MFRVKKREGKDGTIDNGCWSFLLSPSHFGSSPLCCLPLMLSCPFLVFIGEKRSITCQQGIDQFLPPPPSPSPFSPTPWRYLKCFCWLPFPSSAPTFCQDHLVLLAVGQDMEAEMASLFFLALVPRLIHVLPDSVPFSSTSLSGETQWILVFFFSPGQMDSTLAGMGCFLLFSSK